MKRFEIFFGIIKIPLDFLMTVFGFYLAYQLRLITEPIAGIAKPIDYTVLPTIHEYLFFSLGTAFALIVVFALGRMYSLKTTSTLSREIGRCLLLGVIWIALIISYFFFIHNFPFSRLAIIYSWFLALALVVIGRALIHGVQLIFLKSGIGRSRLLLIGKNNLSGELAAVLQKNPAYKIVDILPARSIKQIEYILKRKKIDEVIQTDQKISEAENSVIFELCELHHINYRFVPDLIELRRSNVETIAVGGIPVISLKPTPLDGWGKVIKRAVDIGGAIFGMIIFSPIFLLTALAIKIDSRGPVLFSRLDDGSPVTRIGQHGQPFRFYKFRSMHPNTHNLRYTKLAKENLRTDGPLTKIKNDPRVTRVGHFIRKYSIDELPQLWNVLVGNLSLVGPRPHFPEEVANYQNHHHFVLTIKPGITGLAQISGRSDLSFEEEVRLDRYYIENWSILLDLRIILKTFAVVLKGYQE